jgi:hypothetical protein
MMWPIWPQMWTTSNVGSVQHNIQWDDIPSCFLIIDNHSILYIQYIYIYYIIYIHMNTILWEQEFNIYWVCLNTGYPIPIFFSPTYFSHYVVHGHFPGGHPGVQYIYIYFHSCWFMPPTCLQMIGSDFWTPPKRCQVCRQDVTSITFPP